MPSGDVGVILINTDDCLNDRKPARDRTDHSLLLNEPVEFTMTKTAGPKAATCSHEEKLFLRYRNLLLVTYLSAAG